MHLNLLIKFCLISIASISLFFIGCNNVNTQATKLIQASILIEASNSYEWIEKVTIPKGTDGYELLEIAVNDELVSEWYPEFRSHFVKQIKGISPKNGQFWSVFLWNESSLKWEPLTVGADLFSVKDGHTMAWSLIKYDPVNPQKPKQLPQ